MHRARGFVLAILALGACVVTPAPADTSDPGSLRARQVIPLTTVTESGHRYVARVDVGAARDVPLMIHGNSRMYLSLTHAIGERLNGRPVPRVERYGYSSRGMGYLHVSRIIVRGHAFTPPADVPVFDFREDGAGPFQGMLGVPFLTSARAAVDFSRDELLLGVERRSHPDARLIVRGYRVTPITLHGRGRATVDVHFPVLGRFLPITPSTVSTALTLHQPLFAGHVKMDRLPSPDRSPNGTTPDEFTADRVDFDISGVLCHSAASFEDFAEYGTTSERELESFGMLGYDWMKEHAAVVDYGNRYLYFKP